MSKRHSKDSRLVVIEVMPTRHRESHRAARNSGRYPHNGAERYSTPPEIAYDMVESDPHWCAIVTGATPSRFEYRDDFSEL